MNKKYTLLLAALIFAPSVRAEVTLFDQNSWKIGMYGFVEMDSFFDTTRSFQEVAGNGAVLRTGTLGGVPDHGRTQFSVRNSRLGFSVSAPLVDEWKTRAVIEMDFLGFNPNYTAGALANQAQSESNIYSNPTLRLRHAYFNAEKNGWTVMVGQNWTLFGWQPQYVLATVSVAPVSGTVYQRSPRIGVLKTLAMNETNDVQVGMSLQRPTQRDGEIPNLDLGVRWANSSIKGGFSGANADIKTQPLSVGVSGTYREYEHPRSSTDTDLVRVPAFAVAVDTLIPILPSSDGKDPSHTLTFSGEFTTGRGYGDQFSGYGGAPLLAASSASVPSNVNLDPSIGGYQNGQFDLVKLRSWNSQLQYHLEGATFATVGYGQLASDNAGSLGGSYKRSETYFANLIHDFTAQIRVGVEFDQFATQYAADGASFHDNRYMVASFYRF